MPKYDVDAEIKKLLARLDDCGEHQFVIDAERAIFSAEGFLNRLVELNGNDEMSDLIAINLDLLSELVGRAADREEDERANAKFYDECEIADLRREIGRAHV